MLGGSKPSASPSVAHLESSQRTIMIACYCKKPMPWRGASAVIQVTHTLTHQVSQQFQQFSCVYNDCRRDGMLVIMCNISPVQHPPIGLYPSSINSAVRPTYSKLVASLTSPLCSLTRFHANNSPHTVPYILSG